MLYSQLLAQIYYAFTEQEYEVIPSGRNDGFWAERIYRHVAGLPDNHLSSGFPSNHYLELWYYHCSGQSHRAAEGMRPDWFWLARLKECYGGVDGAGINPANAAVASVNLLAAIRINLESEPIIPPVTVPEIRVTIDGATIADGGTFNAGNVALSASVLKTVTIHNDGDANLTVNSPPTIGGELIGGVITGAIAGVTTILPGQNATFIVTLITTALGAKIGSVSIVNNDSDENPFNLSISFNVTL